MNIAILASGNGTNFEAIAKAAKQGRIKADIKFVLTDKEDAFVRKRAARIGIRDLFVDPRKFASRLGFDKEIVKLLKKEKIDLIVLAGFMRILSPEFVKSFKNKILNIHPALLPAFKGEDAIKMTYRYGCKVAGVTVHFVDKNVDNGPIVLQEAIIIKEGLGLPELEEKIHSIEHRLYPQAINLYIQNKLKIRGRRVEII
ncbi:MAG: phosphoribosylglycinamide formyltransferase [Candidatus Omnitrophota bacterium]|jgi:phosphoribosylglycinamide formyltransferase-1